MPFVQGKCESCGGILTVDPSLKAANCPFCGTAYVVQDSINYYNTTIKVDTMHADVVNVSDESTSEGRLKAADAYMKLRKYAEAETEYKRVTELTPQNYKGWIGLIAAHTYDYKKRIRSARELRVLADYAKSAKTFAPKDMSNTLLEKYEVYKNEETLKNTNDINAYNNAISEQTASWNQLDAQEKSLQDKYTQTNDRIVVLTKLTNEYQKGNSRSTDLIWMLSLLGAGILSLFLFVVIGIVLILSAGVPGFLLVFRMVQDKNRRKEIDRLNSEQNDTFAQMCSTVKQQNAFYDAIQINQKDLKAYS